MSFDGVWAEKQSFVFFRTIGLFCRNHSEQRPRDNSPTNATRETGINNNNIAIFRKGCVDTSPNFYRYFRRTNISLEMSLLPICIRICTVSGPANGQVSRDDGKKRKVLFLCPTFLFVGEIADVASFVSVFITSPSSLQALDSFRRGRGWRANVRKKFGGRRAAIQRALGSRRNHLKSIFQYRVSQNHFFSNNRVVNDTQTVIQGG